MDRVLLLLPVAVSLSSAIAAGSLFLALRMTPDEIRAPQIIKRDVPDPYSIKSGFSKVFEKPGKEKGGSKASTAFRDIRLIGLSWGDVPLAMLKVGDKKLILLEGESKKGVTLKKVLKDSVVIVSEGKEVTLKIPKKDIKTASTSGREPVPQENYQSGGTGQEFRVSRREIERITKDPGVMFREVRLVPYVKGGKTEGFIFEWIKPGSLLYKAGLRPGDILVSINNNTIRSGEDAFRLLQILRNEPNLRVQIIRNGHRRDLFVRVE